MLGRVNIVDYAIFRISSLEFIKMQYYLQKVKETPQCSESKYLIWIHWKNIDKKVLYMKFSLSNFSNCKSSCKRKSNNIWVFLGRNLKKQQQQQQLLTYLESVPFGIRVSCKTKNSSNLEPKKPYLSIFGL